MGPKDDKKTNSADEISASSDTHDQESSPGSDDSVFDFVMDFTAEEQEAIERLVRELDQGYGMSLGSQIRLDKIQIAQLKSILDKKIYGEVKGISVASDQYSISAETMASSEFALDLSESGNTGKMSPIPVIVEKTINGHVLVKVGPHDLSGVGGLQMRDWIVKDVVNQALRAQGIDKSYQDVDVCANLGVRGRKQMLFGLFSKNDPANHQNAFIKMAGENNLTRWEPRDGPQSFFNDTICAMASTVMLALFEYGLKSDKITSSQEATDHILKSPVLRDIFDSMLTITKGRITYLVDTVNVFKDDIVTPPPTEHKGYTPQ